MNPEKNFGQISAYFKNGHTKTTTDQFLQNAPFLD
jgi:hypothetical protein